METVIIIISKNITVAIIAIIGRPRVYHNWRRREGPVWMLVWRSYRSEYIRSANPRIHMQPHLTILSLSLSFYLRAHQILSSSNTFAHAHTYTSHVHITTNGRTSTKIPEDNGEQYPLLVVAQKQHQRERLIHGIHTIQWAQYFIHTLIFVLASMCLCVAIRLVSRIAFRWLFLVLIHIRVNATNKPISHGPLCTRLCGLCVLLYSKTVRCTIYC